MKTLRIASALLSVVLVLLLLAVRVLDPYPVRTARELFFDQFQRLAPRAFQPLPVRVVDIDENSVAALGQWPWPRDRLAAMVDRLMDLGAAAVAFDVLFVEPDRLSPALLARDPRVVEALGLIGANRLDALPDNDYLFAEAIRDRPVVLAFGVHQQSDTRAPRPLAGVAQVGNNPAQGLLRFENATPIVPILEAAAAGIGSVSMSPGGNVGAVRRVPLMWSDGEHQYPGLALEALRVAQGASTIVLFGAGDADGVVRQIRVGDFEVPTTGAGEVWVRYRHEDRRLYVPAVDLFEADPQELVDAIAGHIVLVGSSATGLLDIRGTTLGENVPGVSIHAQILEQILTGDFLQRTDWLEGAELAAFVVLCLIIIVLLALTGPIASFVIGGIAAAAVLGASWYAFRHMGLLVDASFPLVGSMAVFGAMSGFRFLIEERERRLLRRSFAHYVAPSLLSQIEASGHKLSLGGEIRDVTVMFSDIRNFTTISEHVSPVELVAMLNRLFSDLGEPILTEAGTIDKFIGDAIMAFWNAPVDVPGHPACACRAALGMRSALQAINAEADSDRRLAVAIGINSGPACVGNLGSRSRFNYSVIGDAVNVASRLETNCRHVDFDILLAAETARSAARFATLEAGQLALKGRSEREPVYILVGDEALALREDFARLREHHERLLQAVREGRDAAASELCARCSALGSEILPALSAFYDRVPHRLEDFRPEQAPGQTLPQRRAMPGASSL